MRCQRSPVGGAASVQHDDGVEEGLVRLGLGVGAIQKRAVVISRGHPIEPSADDSIAIRPMVYLSFTFDHRVLDGASADRFVMMIKQTLEEWK